MKKLKPGTVVQIRKDLGDQKRFPDEYPGLLRPMRELSGQYMTIKECIDSYAELQNETVYIFDESPCYWTPKWFTVFDDSQEDNWNDYSSEVNDEDDSMLKLI